MAAAKSDSSTAPPVLQEGLHDRAQSPDLAEEEEVALDRSWTRVERPTAGEASEPETEAAGYGSLRARFSLRFRSFRRLAGLPAGTADEKEASTEGQEDTFSPMKLLLYSLCFLAGATVPVLLVNIVKVLFRTVLEVGGWRACAITAMVALFVFPAPKRTPMKLAYPLAAGLGWFAAVFVSITPHICIAIVVPCGLAYGYFVHAEEESVSWWWTREDAVRILSVLENVREFNVVRAAVGSTAKVFMGGFAQMWLASKEGLECRGRGAPRRCNARALHPQCTLRHGRSLLSAHVVAQHHQPGSGLRCPDIHRPDPRLVPLVGEQAHRGRDEDGQDHLVRPRASHGEPVHRLLLQGTDVWCITLCFGVLFLHPGRL